MPVLKALPAALTAIFLLSLPALARDAAEPSPAESSRPESQCRSQGPVGPLDGLLADVSAAETSTAQAAPDPAPGSGANVTQIGSGRCGATSLDDEDPVNVGPFDFLSDLNEVTRKLDAAE